MGVRWTSRLDGGSLNWTSLTGTTEGQINGSAEVLESVERDLTLVYQINSGVTSDLSLLWQLDANPITAVESDLSLTWNLIVEAGTSVESDLELLWQRGGSVISDMTLDWAILNPVIGFNVTFFQNRMTERLSQSGMNIEIKSSRMSIRMAA